jgi:RHS repeat-associated protein
MTFVFSNCDAGVTFQATILDWIRDANGNVSPTAVQKIIQGTTITYNYAFFGSFKMAIGSNIQTASGPHLPDGSTGRPLGSLGIMYTNLGVDSIPAATSFLLQSPNAAGLGVGTGAATSKLAWTASLYGVGNLMPNGLLSPLPAIGAWQAVNTFIEGDGNLLARPITSYAPCPASLAGKVLGIPLCACGDPINPATGNLFEHVADYRTWGANQLGFDRYYNSLAGADTVASTMGGNWRSGYDRYLRVASSSSVVAERADGRQLAFTLTGSAWAPDNDVGARLTNSGQTWTLTDVDDSVETYTTANATQALLRTIRARNGYTQTLQYNASNQLTGVTDSYNRSLAFTYEGGLLRTVTTPDALILTYSYTAAGGHNRLITVNYSTSPGITTTYLYENASLPTALTGILDENGDRYATWTYDSSGRATSSQHGSGADLTQIGYNSDGTRTVTYPLGAVLTYHFSTLQGMPKVTQIDRAAAANVAAATRKFTYDSNGYLASQTDWSGNSTTYTNDSRGLQTTIVTAAGTPLASTTSVTYQATLHLPARIAKPGVTIAFTYDTAGNLLTRTETDTTTTAIPYSTNGTARTWTYTWANFLLTKVQNPRTDVPASTQFTYDNSGALASITNAAGKVTRITQHLPGGWPQTVVDANGITTTFNYDSRFRMQTVVRNASTNPLTTTFKYDPAGNLLSITRPDGSALSRTYDPAHRLTGVGNLFNEAAAFRLDAMGNRLQSDVFDAGGNRQRTSSAQYDALGRIRQDLGGEGQTTAYDYDANDNILTITAPLGRVTRQTFDARNRRTKITDAGLGATTFTYDAQDRLATVTDANGASTTYTYNGFGDLIQRNSADSGTTVYRYDADGNLMQRVDANGGTVNFTYDALDRVTTVSYPARPAENVTYTYDEDGHGSGIRHLTSVTDAAGALSRSFDELGQLVGETRVNGAANLRTTYTYDAAGRIASLTYPSGWTVVYGRDAMGRITGISARTPAGDQSFPVLTDLSYAPFGPVSALTYGNGIGETRSFDSDFRLTRIASTVQDLSYTFDAAGNVTSIADALTPDHSQTLAYDAMNRLTQASGAYGALEYGYDAVGNRLSQTRDGVATNYTYPARSSQLASVTNNGQDQPVMHTKSGQVSSYTSPAGDQMAISYNAAGRIESVAANGSVTAQYSYDAFGHRLKKVGAGTTLYQYDVNGRLLEEADDQGQAIADYIYLGNSAVAVIAPASGQISFLHNDHRGVPQLATDSAQNPAWVANYMPFGEMANVPMNIVQDLRMPGQEFDAETGLYHNGFRNYVPEWGRYLETDPIGLLGGVNTYAYANANPIRMIDRLGLETDFANAVTGLDKDTLAGLVLEGSEQVDHVLLAKEFLEGYNASDQDIQDFISSGGFQNPCTFKLAKAIGIEFQLLNSLLKGDPPPFDISMYDYSEGYSRDTLISIAENATDPLARAAAVYQLERQSHGNLLIFDSNNVLIGGIHLGNDPPPPPPAGTVNPVTGPFVRPGF